MLLGPPTSANLDEGKEDSIDEGLLSFLTSSSNDKSMVGLLNDIEDRRWSPLWKVISSGAGNDAVEVDGLRDSSFDKEVFDADDTEEDTLSSSSCGRRVLHVLGFIVLSISDRFFESISPLNDVGELAATSAAKLIAIEGRLILPPPASTTTRLGASIGALFRSCSISAVGVMGLLNKEAASDGRLDRPPSALEFSTMAIMYASKLNIYM